MRHARRNVRLSRPSEHRHAVLSNLAKSLLQHGHIRTTVTKAKEAQRVVDRLITLGKEGSVHSRRQAYRLLQDHLLVKRLFADVAPQFLDSHGGYTRVLKLHPRPGDGAAQALLELTRAPADLPKATTHGKVASAAAPKGTAPAQPATQEPEPHKKPKRFLEGLRELFKGPQKGGQSS